MPLWMWLSGSLNACVICAGVMVLTMLPDSSAPGAEFSGGCSGVAGSSSPPPHATRAAARSKGVSEKLRRKNGVDMA